MDEKAREILFTITFFGKICFQKFLKNICQQVR